LFVQVWSWPEALPGSYIGEALNSIIMKLLQKNKESRYQSG